QNFSSLQVTDWHFSIPVSATINGIAVRAKRSQEAGTARKLELLNGGALAQKTYVGGGQACFNAGDSTLGAPTDLWGTTWSSSQINNSAFGVRYTTGGLEVVDGFEISVTYTDFGPN